MSKWEKVRLGNVIDDIKDGGTPSRNNPDFFGGNINWVVIDDIKDEIWKTREQLTELGFRNCSSNLWKIGSVILSTGATIGEVGIAKIPCATKQGICGIEVKSDYIIPVFLKYYFQNQKPILQNLSQGSTIKEIRPKAINELEIFLPPLPIQTRIAEILSTADKTIENSEKLIAKYKRMKTGMMQDLLTKGIDENGNIRSEARHKFKDSPLGKIPEEWEVGTTLNNLYMKGRIGWQGLKSSEFLEEGNYLITGIHFNGNNRVDWNQCYRVSEFRYLQDPDIQVKEDDLLLTKDGTIGKLAYIDYLPGKATLNSHLLVLRPLTDNIIPKYLFYQLLSERFKIFINNIKTGSTLAGLTQSNFGKYLLAIPPKNEQERIKNALDQIFYSMESEIQNLTKLKRLKTGLMNDLLSGKVEVVESGELIMDN